MADVLVYQYRSNEPTLESRPAYQKVGQQYRSLQDTFTGTANLDWAKFKKVDYNIQKRPYDSTLHIWEIIVHFYMPIRSSTLILRKRYIMSQLWFDLIGKFVVLRESHCIVKYKKSQVSHRI